MKAGVTLYIGRGWAFHLSTEHGFERERADHRTLRLGLIVAIRDFSRAAATLRSEEREGRALTAPVSYNVTKLLAAIERGDERGCAFWLDWCVSDDVNRRELLELIAKGAKEESGG